MQSVIRRLAPLLLLLVLLAPIAARAQDMPGFPAELGGNIGVTVPTGAANVADMVGHLGFFRAIWHAIAVPIDAGTIAIITAMATYVSTQFRLLVAAYLMAMMLYRAATFGGDGWQPYAKFLISGYLINAIASNPDTYMHWVVGPFFGVINGVAKAIGGAFGGNANVQVAADSFDQLALRMARIGSTVWNNTPNSYMAMLTIGFLLVVYLVLVLLSVGAMFILFMQAYILVALAIAVGPIFVAMAFFPLTKRYFAGWLTAIGASGVAMIMIQALMGLFQAVVVAVMEIALGVFKSGTGAEVVVQCYMLAFGIVAVMAMVWMTYALLGQAKMIAGAAHAEFLRWGDFFAPSSSPGSSTHSSSSVPSGSGVAAGSGGSPSRSYPFQRTVGSAR
jgi:hypothetical protein